jgi:molybdenum cofactor cytidylyltransferase
MARSPSFAAVILAAGKSARMGQDKALLPWPPVSSLAAEPASTTFLSTAIRSLSFATDFVLVVAGKNQAALAPIVYANGASLVVNPDPDRGQFSSLQTGLQEVLNRGRDTAIITLVDRPPAAAATVQALRNFFETSEEDIWAVIPEYAGRHGHPYIAGRELTEAFLRAPASSNARAIVQQLQAHIRYVPVDDPAIAANINAPEDYAALMKRFENCSC